MRKKVLSGVSVVAYLKDTIKYGMTCAWIMPCDYDQLLLLLGSQSDTANGLEVGDKIGISILSQNQKDIALHFGDNHSKTFDKFDGVKYELDENSIVISNSKSKFVCEVVKIGYIEGNDEDHLVQVKILKEDVNEELEFLAMTNL